MIEPNSLDMPMSDQCAFCAYLNGTRPYTILARTNLVAVFVTREQRGLPHLLVLPTEHRPTVLDLTDDEAEAVGLWIRDVARAIDTSYGRPGIAVWQNNGLPAHQTIDHTHFHLAGTLDGGGTDWGDVPELTLDETNAIGDRIRPHLIHRPPSR